MTERVPMAKCWAGSHRYGLVPASDTGTQGAGPQAGLGGQGPRGLPLRHRQGGGEVAGMPLARAGRSSAKWSAGGHGDWGGGAEIDRGAPGALDLAESLLGTPCNLSSSRDT